LVRSQVLHTYLQRASGSLRVVSFDVFDTLLIRMVPSERVIHIAAENLCALLGKPLLVPVLVHSRREFSTRIRQTSTNGEAEWTVSQWLEAFARTQGFDVQRLLHLGRQAELQAEMDCLRLADEAVAALSVVKHHGLRAIAISDMWLDQAWLQELLAKFGLFFDDVFSSGTMKYSKSQGAIFQAVASHMNCTPIEWMLYD
jgi:predicted HAD superfamily hydrolase